MLREGDLRKTAVPSCFGTEARLVRAKPGGIAAGFTPADATTLREPRRYEAVERWIGKRCSARAFLRATANLCVTANMLHPLGVTTIAPGGR